MLSTKYLLVLITVLLIGCDIGTESGMQQSNSLSNADLIAVFKLADTTGQISTVFHSREMFDMSFSLTNTTEDTLTYHFSFPPVIFKILKNDTVVASSIDGFAFTMDIRTGYVAPGASLQGRWRAPNTGPQNPKVVLSPGMYEASVSFATFDQVRVNPVSRIAFSVVQ